MKIFNSEFEVSMRVLLLLAKFKDGLDKDKIMYLDFFTIYAKNYNLGEENINGNSSFMINDLSLQPLLYENAIKELVLDGLINVRNTNEGFYYQINNDGTLLCDSMSSNYAEIYKVNSQFVYNKFSNSTLQAIKRFAKEMEVRK